MDITNFQRIMELGGWVMYPLLVCSLAIWSLTFYKVWSFYKVRNQIEEIYQKALVLLKENKVAECRGLSHNVDPVVRAPFSALFQEDFQNSRDKWERSISRNLSESQMKLKGALWVLGTIGTSAPFIGLFGTVLGIIKSFQSMGETGRGGFSVVAAGLSEALIATAAGILVAIMAVILYNFFQTRLSKIHLSFKNKLEDLLDQLDNDKSPELT